MAVNLLNKVDYMCSLDLGDAYLQISIYREDRKYLKFEYKNKLYQVNAFLIILCRHL